MDNNIKNCNMDKPFVFVSYSKQDSAKVYPLIEKLQSLGCNIWIDKELNKAVGKNWQTGALGALRNSNCKAVLFFMSCNSLWSAPVCAELLFSSSETVKDNNNGNPLKIIPINASDSWTPQKQNFHDLVYIGEADSAPYANENLSKSDYDVLRAVGVDEKYLNKESVTAYLKHKDITKHIYKNVFGPEPEQITIASIEDMNTIKINIPTEVFTKPEEAAMTTTPYVAPAPAIPASVPASAVDNTNDDTVNTPVPADKPQAKSGKKQATSTGDITFTLYGKEYTTNQADMMLTFFAQVLVRHQDIISELNSYKGMNFVSATDYSKKENKTDDMLPYFNSCHYFEFPNGDGLCVGTSFSVNDKLKKMALLLSICGEDTSVFHSEQVELPKLKSQAEKGDSSRSGNSSGVNFRVFDESFSLNQTDMLGVICSRLIEKHPDKLAEAADSLLCIDMKDYTGVPKEDKPVYFGSMNQYYLGTTPYCVGGSFGMKDKLKMISKLIAICEEDANCIEIEGYDIPAPKASRTSSKKSSFDYFG